MFIDHDSPEEQYKKIGMDSTSIENTILSLISSKEKVIQLNVNPFNKK